MDFILLTDPVAGPEGPAYRLSRVPGLPNCYLLCEALRPLRLCGKCLDDRCRPYRVGGSKAWMPVR